MFSGFFNYDNPVWRFIGKFFDVMILNVLWVICSIPIVTIGASTTAVYYVTLKLVRDQDSTTVKAFFKSFKENFKQATIIWLILLAVGLVLGADFYILTTVQAVASTVRNVMLAVFVMMAAVLAGIMLYVFPLQCRFYNPVKRTLFNAFFMSIRHLLHTIGLLAMDLALPLLAFTVAPMLQPLLFLFGFPLMAFFNSYIFAMIFDKYMPEQKEEELEDRMWEIPEDVGAEDAIRTEGIKTEEIKTEENK